MHRPLQTGLEALKLRDSGQSPLGSGGSNRGMRVRPVMTQCIEIAGVSLHVHLTTIGSASCASRSLSPSFSRLRLAYRTCTSPSPPSCMHLRARVCTSRYHPREQRRATQSVLPAQARESADGGGYARLKHGLTVRLRLQRLLQRLHTQRHRSALLLLQRLEARKLCLDSIDLSVRLLDLCACRGSKARTRQHERTRSHACPRGSRAGAEHCARQRGSLVHACSRDSTRGRSDAL